jgi:predicted ATP-grasp superfamily ATP-dependent carboligase
MAALPKTSGSVYEPLTVTAYGAGTCNEGALLFLGDYNGTLAAARCLGRRGIDVALADDSPMAMARASRYVRHFERSPPIGRPEDFIEWLIDRGRGGGRGKRRANYAGRVLFPANDEQVFLFAQHRLELSRYFRLYQPGFDTIYRILNKQRLYQACERVGIDYPATWYPRGEAELRELAPTIRVDVMVKPKSQIQLESKTKGSIVPRGGSVVDCYSRFMRENHYGTKIAAYDADVVWPMLQAYHSSHTHRIYTLSGFTDWTGKPPLIRAATKLVQRPRNMGIGVCFEAAKVDSALVARVAELFRDLNYYGIFDIEFIEREGKFLLIDFNPRGYGQMAFEIARGLPLPYIQYLAAMGDGSRLADVYQLASDWQPRGNEAYCHGLFLSLVNTVQRANALISGSISEDWGSWMRVREARLTDAVRQPSDPGPARLDVIRHGVELMRHPRSFLRSLMR